MSRKIDYSETDKFARSLMETVCSGLNETVLEKLDAFVAWEGFREEMETIWPCSVDTGGPGRSSWDAVMMLKVFVYGKLHGNLSAAQLEEHSKVNIRVKRFLGLGLARYPDEKTIYKYSWELLKSGRWEELYDRCLEQLAVKGYQVKEGVMIPAITIADRVPRQGVKEKARAEAAE